jgi:thioredoxin reductase
MKIAVIGAGPVGLEAAVAAELRGCEVEIYERGEIADSVRRWGFVRMFSPFGMNASQAGVERLQQRGIAVPAADEILTGSEYASRYLEPLARSFGSRLHTHTEVLGVGRSRTMKTEKIGEPVRAETPFRLLLRDGDRERYADAEVIFDCSGTFQNPNPLGDGGLPALGEMENQDRIQYGTPDLKQMLGALPGNAHLLVAGGGHSAAHLICEAAKWKAQHPGFSITWILRRQNERPCTRLETDELPERDRLAAEANHLVENGEVAYLAGTTVEFIHRKGDRLEITLAKGAGSESLLVDGIVSATGFRPDLQLTRELQVQTCWATEGTYKLAAALLGETGADCLAIPAFGAETLMHPEPNYFTLGMKSYGRTPNFLIQTGLRQIEDLLNRLVGASGVLENSVPH